MINLDVEVIYHLIESRTTITFMNNAISVLIPGLEQK